MRRFKPLHIFLSIQKSRGTDLAPPSLGDESSIFDDVESIRAASGPAKAK
jgi:hypothetical protein